MSLRGRLVGGPALAKPLKPPGVAGFAKRKDDGEGARDSTTTEGRVPGPASVDGLKGSAVGSGVEEVFLPLGGMIVVL